MGAERTKDIEIDPGNGGYSKLVMIIEKSELLVRSVRERWRIPECK
jgi:hypothetical protein